MVVSVDLSVDVMFSKWIGVCVGWVALSKVNLVLPALVSPCCYMYVDMSV